MKEQFDSNAIAKLGWRQGAILGDKLAVSALHHAPVRSPAEDDGWLIVTSHDCDVVNFSIVLGGGCCLDWPCCAPCAADPGNSLRKSAVAMAAKFGTKATQSLVERCIVASGAT